MRKNVVLNLVFFFFLTSIPVKTLAQSGSGPSCNGDHELTTSGQILGIETGPSGQLIATLRLPADSNSLAKLFVQLMVTDANYNPVIKKAHIDWGYYNGVYKTRSVQVEAQGTIAKLQVSDLPLNRNLKIFLRSLDSCGNNIDRPGVLYQTPAATSLSALRLDVKVSRPFLNYGPYVSVDFFAQSLLYAKTYIDGRLLAIMSHDGNATESLWDQFAAAGYLEWDWIGVSPSLIASYVSDSAPSSVIFDPLYMKNGFMRFYATGDNIDAALAVAGSHTIDVEAFDRSGRSITTSTIYSGN